MESNMKVYRKSAVIVLLVLWCLISMTAGKKIDRNKNHHGNKHHIDKYVTEDCPYTSAMAKENIRRLGDSCFYFENHHTMSFYDAQKFCRNIRGSLVQVKSNTMYTFVRNALRTSFRKSEFFWIGQSYSSKENDFKWINRKTQMNARQRCLAMRGKDGKWRNFSCKNGHHHSNSDGKLRFICEYAAVDAERPTSSPHTHIPMINWLTTTEATIHDCPPSLPRDRYLKVFRNYCFRFEVHDKRNQLEAQTDCKRSGGSLAIVNSEDINVFITRELSKNFKSHEMFWIGLTTSYYGVYDDVNNIKHVYKWEDGTPLTFSNFAKEPANYRFWHRSKECVTIDAAGGKWWYYPCQNSHRFWSSGKPYICEYRIKPEEPLTTQRTLHSKSTSAPQVNTVIPDLVSSTHSTTTLTVITQKPATVSTSNTPTTEFQTPTIPTGQSSTRETSKTASTTKSLSTPEKPEVTTKTKTPKPTTTHPVTTQKPSTTTNDIVSTVITSKVSTSTTKITTPSLPSTTTFRAMSDIPSPKTNPFLFPQIIEPTYKIISVIKFGEKNIKSK